MKEEIRLLEQRLRELEDLSGRLRQCMKDIKLAVSKKVGG